MGNTPDPVKGIPTDFNGGSAFRADMTALADYFVDELDASSADFASLPGSGNWPGRKRWVEDEKLWTTWDDIGGEWVRDFAAAFAMLGISSAFDLDSGTPTAVIWDTQVVTLPGAWSGGNPTRLVLPREGYWHAEYSVPAQGASDGRVARAIMYRNGVAVGESGDQRAGVPTLSEPHLRGSALVQSNGTNYLETRVSITNTAGDPEITNASRMWATFVGLNP